MAAQSSYQKRKDEIYTLCWRINLALQLLDQGRIESAKIMLKGGLDSDELRNCVIAVPMEVNENGTNSSND